MKKIKNPYFISLIACAVIVVAAAAFFVRAQAVPAASQGGSTASQFPPAVSSSTLPDYLGSVTDVFGSYPSGPTLAIGTPQGTVTVHNFYSADVPVDEVQDLVFKETQDYLMVYDPENSSFWLAITGTPFDAWRTVAEQDFLQTLGITESDACRLYVTEGVIYSAGDPNDGIPFPLTFCSSSASTSFSQ